MGDIGIDILKTDAPVCKYFMSMNRLYLLLNMNNDCYRGQDFTTLSIVVTMYREDADGELNPDDVVWTWSNTYERHMFNRMEEEAGLPFNIYVDIDNYWGEIQLNYNYSYDYNGTGGNNFISKSSVFKFDNRQTVLVTQEVTPFFTDMFRDNVEKDKEFNVWFDRPNESHKPNDLVSDARAGMIKQVIQENGESRIIPAEKNYMGLITYVLNHSSLSSVIYRQYPEGIPAEATVTFKLFANRQSFLMHFRGDLRYLSYI